MCHLYLKLILSLMFFLGPVVLHASPVYFRGEVISKKPDGSMGVHPNIGFRISAINISAIDEATTDASGSFEQKLIERLEPGTKIQISFSDFYRVLYPPNGIMFMPNNKTNNSLSIVIAPKKSSNNRNIKIRNPIKKAILNYCDLSNNKFYVQVASFNSFKKAQEVEYTLKPKYKACTIPVIVRGQKYHRVLVFLKEKSTSKAVCDSINKFYKYDCINFK